MTATREGRAIRVTRSIRYSYPVMGETLDALLERRDAASYRAKSNGQERVALSAECIP